MSAHDGATPLDRHLAELHLDPAHQPAASRANPAHPPVPPPHRAPASRPPDTAPPEQQSSALLRLPHDIRLLVWEEAVGKRYLHLAQSYSGPHTPPAPAAAFQPGQGQQQHYRGYYGQRCLECHPACYHCTLLAATEFVDFDVRLAARRRANADVRGVAAVVLVCRLV